MFETDLEQSEHTGSFLYWSIPRYALREYLLKRRSSEWIPIPGVVESTYRSAGGYRQTIRAELRYSYSFKDTCYSGLVVRDTGFSVAAANNLVGHSTGEKIVVLTNPNNPEQSYFPSGFGYTEPIIVGLIFGGCLLAILMMLTFELIGMLLGKS